MPELDALLLSRIQFAFTIGYHIIFPSLSIGLAQYLVFLEWKELRTGNPSYRQRYDFWARIFALSFGMGVVSGVVLSYELGTNFGRFSEIAGPVVGPLMSYEVLTAFFLEAGFLGIVLLGRNRVSPKVHFFATCMVALGTLISAFWIIAANSFMHTPAGYQIVDGVVHPESWLEIIFNPSFPYRYTHMVLAALVTTCFVVASVGAWYLRKGRDTEFAQKTLRNALLTAALLMPVQIFVGDLHGLNTLKHQPTKVAAMEANWETRKGAPFVLFAWPDQDGEKNHYEIAIPKLASLILTHDLDGELQGLKAVPPEDRPPVAIVFFSFRIMLACGMLMLLLAVVGAFLSLKGKLTNSGFSRLYLRALVYSGPLGFIAILAGWTTTEVGRQPWTVHGLLRTQDAATVLPGSSVAFTLLLFVVVYTVLFFAFLKYFGHLVRKGPGHHGDHKHGSDISRPAFVGGE